MYIDERVDSVEVGKVYSLEILLDYVNRTGGIIISNTICRSIPSVDYKRKIRIIDFKENNVVYQNNTFSEKNIVFADYE